MFSSCCDGHYYICDSCVFQCINHSYSCYSGPTSLGLELALGQHDVVQPLPFIPRDTVRGIVGFTTVLQKQPLSGVHSQAYANYAMSVGQGSFLQRCTSHQFPYIGACYSVCFLHLCLYMAFMFTNRVSAVVFCITTTLWSIPMAVMSVSLCWSTAHTWLAEHFVAWSHMCQRFMG